MTTTTLFDRYVLLETLQILILGTLSIIGIFFGTAEFQHMLEMMGQIGIPINTVLTIMMLQLPSGMSYCLPGGVVVAVMLVLSRCSRDNEILAMQVLGTRFRRVLTPFFVLGLLSSYLAFSISEHLAPQTRDLSRRLFNIAVHKTERPFPNQSEIRLESQSGQVTRIFELGPSAGACVNGFVSFDLAQKNVVGVVWAQSAEWKDHAWRLHAGRLFELSNDDTAGDAQSRFTSTQFASMQLPGTNRAQKFLDRTTLDKTTRELKADIDLSKTFSTQAPPYLLFQYYRRFSHPLSCLFLVIAAAPLVLLRRRKGVDLSLVYGGVVVASFFFLQELCLGLVCNHRLDPLWGAWLPGSGLLVIGLLLTLYLKRR